MRPTNKKFEPGPAASPSSSGRRRSFTKGRFMVHPDEVEFVEAAPENDSEPPPLVEERRSKWELRTAHLPVGALPVVPDPIDEPTEITVDLTDQDEPVSYFQRRSASLPRLSETDD